MMYFSNLLGRAATAALLVTLITACGGGGGGSAPTPSAPAQSNALSVTVDAGPAGPVYNVNRLYTTIKVCQPGTTQCKDIDHVLVDTGSFGLRLLSSVMAMAPAVNLNRATAASGFPLLNCVQFVDNSFAWGPVATADIVLGSKTAASVLVQVIADPAFNSLAAACASGTAINTAATLGANGILGIGLFKEDCGSACTNNANNGFYYTCTNASCTATTGATASPAQQVKNPVPLFASDNNGVLIDLPAVSSATAPSLSGSLIFGVGTQSNNQLVSGAVLLTSSVGDITTLIAGKTLATSFIDSGSNGLFFDSSTIPPCPTPGPAAGFYCPSSLTTLSATLLGANAVAFPVSFSIDNALALFTSYPNAVLPTLSGPLPGYPNTFDWGLPFFYGRRVFIGIEGQPSTLGTGPFYAF